MSEICVSKFKNKSGDLNLNTGCFGYGSYLFSRKGTLYFRIAVPNYLHSLLKKKEIRKSLGTGRLREARPLALRYAVLSRQITVRSFVNWFELEYRGDCRHTKPTAGIRICRRLSR